MQSLGCPPPFFVFLFIMTINLNLPLCPLRIYFSKKMIADHDLDYRTHVLESTSVLENTGKCYHFANWNLAWCLAPRWVY